jgi:moderate conductance mechanosensitive channel
MAALLMILAVAANARAADPPAAPPSAATADQAASRAQIATVLAILNDPTQRAKLIATLQTLEKAAPATPTPAAAKPAAVPASGVPIAANSLLPQLLSQLSVWSAGIAAQTLSLGRTLDGLPAVWAWLISVASEPDAPRAATVGAGKILLCLAAAFAAGWLIRRLSRSSMARLARHADARWERPNDPSQRNREIWRRLRILPLALLRLALELLATGCFAAVGFMLPSWILDPVDPVRPVILALVDAFMMFGVVMAAVRLLVSPGAPKLRPLPLSDAASAAIAWWTGVIVAVATFGMTAASLGALWGMAGDTVLAVEKLVVLVDHALLVAVVLRYRQAVSAFILPRPGSAGAFASVRYAVATIWHYIAIFVIVGLWFVWAADLQDGYMKVLQVVGVTCAVLLGARVVAMVLVFALDRMAARTTPQLTAAHPALQARAERYHHLLRHVVPVAVGVAAGIVLLQLVGLDAFDWLTLNPVGEHLIAAALSIGVTIVIAIAVWEAANIGVEQYLDRLTREAQFARAARLRTVLPILRTALFLTVLIVAALTTLGQIGVNIAPLLAGAGIVGVAIGFGSQKLVQDFITGIFLLLESAMQVGDAVTLAGVSGVVEHLSIRTIRLRAGDGSTYLIPFSSVTTVNNFNRGQGNAVVSVSVAAHEDTDRVGDVLKQVAKEMRAEDAYKTGMLGELDLWGVDQVNGATVTLAGQIACTDGGRWGVQREFNRRYKKRFQELGIELGVPTQGIVLHDATPKPAAAETPEAQPRLL